MSINILTPSYTSDYTPVWDATADKNIVIMNELGGDILVRNSLVNAPNGSDIEIRLIQDSEGGRLIVFESDYNIINNNFNYDASPYGLMIFRGTVRSNGIMEGKIYPVDDSGIITGNLQITGQVWSGLNTLEDDTTIVTNCDQGNRHIVVLEGNRTMDAPSNIKSGAEYTWIIDQGLVGTRLITWDSIFKWPGGTPPTLSTTAGSIDIIRGISYDGSTICVSSLLNFS